ncbi:Metal-dependent hydrolase, endonuclease/exonuclease/phosphatase family [Actinopolymorpha cephalotaxi]|uniref:Endonuclease/exonuclease/phosphatase family metal-dependent hydrolase n=1 Tax=Actinopolymorpha cephalotaxi TaxID=504797 RepID=A0A1I2SRE5_9ACTN|nr:endonuclease/exonuclease/phosphatase family protein [Actinopolymorpha cephalotaxi]NYH84044.1 endonuclease/exonuclease/phosphatase family metal-dependent hydrolase [Actinopolymorpha cephalotaxi]SFG54359.1 Metal-dependent hydrolase, endonuclease/exonuclease/phosphatase family [Actinopolymorpha cephalotaxi]
MNNPLVSRRSVLVGAGLAAVAGIGVAPDAMAATFTTPADPNVASAASTVRLRAATYNIHAGLGQDNVFDLDLDRTAAAIRALDADLIGLQEVDVHWGTRSGFVDEAHALAERLDMHVFFAPIYDLDPATPGAERRQYGVAVLSRYPILAAENHDLTRLSTQDPNPVPAPAPGFPEVTVNVRGVRVHFYTTHLDYRSDPSVRAAQVKDMLAILAADSGPKILVGDFNAEPGAVELAPLWDHLTDAAPGGDDTYPADVPDKRIDLITVSPEVAVRRVRTVATLASDHRPVVADLAILRPTR